MPPLFTVGEYTHVAPDAFVRGTRFSCVADECIRHYGNQQAADATPHASELPSSTSPHTALPLPPETIFDPPIHSSDNCPTVPGHQISRPL
jgi:hypothetical protein